ncbi:MAG: hypothetical protein MUF72_09065 [Elainella sp. Prado103]|nr:hypothetical protein [Elainella sp. Prado103]
MVRCVDASDRLSPRILTQPIPPNPYPTPTQLHFTYLTDYLTELEDRIAHE